MTFFTKQYNIFLQGESMVFFFFQLSGMLGVRHLFFIFSGVCLEQNLLTNKRNPPFDEERSSQENTSGKK